jgi:hypothetical protein
MRYKREKREGRRGAGVLQHGLIEYDMRFQLTSIGLIEYDTRFQGTSIGLI